MQDLTIRQEIFTRIDALAEKMGVVGEHLWEVLAKQVYVEAGKGIALILLSGVVLLLAGTFVTPRWQKWLSNNTDDENPGAAFLFGAMLVIVGIVHIVGWVTGVSALIQIANPEYYALQRILEIMK